MAARDDLKDILDQIQCPFGNGHEMQKRRIFELFKQMRSASNPGVKVETITIKDTKEEDRLREQVRVLEQKLQLANAKATRLEAELAAAPKEEPPPRPWVWASPSTGRRQSEYRAFFHGMLIGASMLIEGITTGTELDDVIRGFFAFWSKLLGDRLGRSEDSYRWSAEAVSCQLALMRKHTKFGEKTAQRIAVAMAQPLADAAKDADSDVVKFTAAALRQTPEQASTTLQEMVKFFAGFDPNPHGPGAPSAKLSKLLGGPKLMGKKDKS